jgi:hypothetical protein
VWAETLTADAEADVILNGDNDNDRDPTLTNTFGRSVASAGDFNGDGWDDVIVADPSDTNPFRNGGTAYIFFGGQAGTISDPDSSADVVLRGQGTFANSVASAGDFNGDGYGDVIIGWAVNSSNGPASGSALIYFGQNYTTQQILDANNDANVVINGRDNNQLGLSVASAGDFNGDGLDDVIIGGGDHAVGGVCGNSVYLFFGADYSTQQVFSAEVAADVVLNAQACNNGFGRSVATAGDFDGDGLDDVIVGAFVDDAGFPYNGIGSAFIYFGGQTGTISDPDSNADVVLNGEGGALGFGQFGWSVASAGDFNGDGFDDVVVGDQHYTLDTFSFLGPGGAFVFFGGQTGTLVASDADLIVSAPGISDQLGYSVASAGDFDGDGLADVIIGSPGVSCEDCDPINGNAYIYFGGRTGVFDDPETSADVVLLGQDLEDFFGRSVASAGDFDGDGLDDVIVGAPGDNNVAQLVSGAAFVFFGSGSVSDSTPPVVSDVLAAPNPVDAGAPTLLSATGDDGASGGSTIISASYSVDGGAPVAMDPADGAFDSAREDVTATLVFDDPGAYEVCVTVTEEAFNTSDPQCIIVEVLQPDLEAPVVSGILADPNPAAVEAPVTVTATVDDTSTGDSEIVEVVLTVDGGDPIAMDAKDGAFDSALEAATATLAFTQAGVYELCVAATDAAGNTSAAECVLLAVFDPDGGFVTGGGFIDSPAGACTLDEDCAEATGKANFGFVSKYKKGAEVPTGSTQFNFSAGGLNFHSESYQWLVVAGARAKYKGIGRVNGADGYGFTLTAIDAALTPSTEVDRFRIKIWKLDNDEEVIYDNERGADENSDPTTDLTGGQIVIHSK